MPLPSSPHVVITGAGSGFGRALATETGRLALEKGAKGVLSRVCDVSKIDQVEALAAASSSAGFGPLDLVVNNAGVSSGGRIGEAPLADWRWTIEIDLFGVIYGCHVFTPILRGQGHGHVLNVASAAGLMHAPLMGAYNVSKAGVVALSETLAAELIGTRIGVTVLCPTFFQTDIAKSGRFENEQAKGAAERLVSGGKSAESIARAALRSVKAGELYCVPMLDARMFWRAKRIMPGAFSKIVGKVAAWHLSRG